MNPEHVEIVKAGATSICDFREQHPHTKIDLADAWLANANLFGANLTNVDLTNARLTNSNLFEANLTSANLTGADLFGSNLSKATLIRSDLTKANLFRADISDADLTEAILADANLKKASLQNSVLAKTNLSGSDLRNANLAEANIIDADFTRCDLGFSNLAGVSLQLARSWEKVNHIFPSYVDHTSIHRIQGQITAELEEFLRGCGLEKWEIENARLHRPGLSPEQISDHLTTNVFPLLTPGSVFLGGVFVSYAHEDMSFVEILYDGMKQQDIQVYLDIHDFTAGSLAKNISRAIRINDQVVVVLSKESLKSDWVWDEIESTLEKEKEIGKDVLFPIRIDDACFEDQRNKRHLNRLVKQRLILDFSDPANFDENLNKLITGMKVNQ